MSLVRRFEASCDALISPFLREWFLTAFSFALLFLLFTADFGADRDLFARVAAGKYFWVEGYVSTIDPFAFTPKLPEWIDHEWLSGVLFYLVADQFGDIGLFLLKLSVCALTLYFLLSASKLVSGKLLPLWFCFCTVNCVAVWQSTVRAQVFTYLCYAILLYLLTANSLNRARRSLFLLPVLFALWINLHGGVALGVITLFIFVAESLLRWQLRLPLIALISVAALLVNPYGPDLLSYLVSALSMERGSITEWAPRPLFSVAAVMINLSLVVVLWSIYKRRNIYSVFEIALFAISYYAAYSHNRLSPFLFMNLAVFGAKSFELLLSELRSKFPIRFMIWSRMLALAGGAVFLVGLISFGRFVLKNSNFSLDYSGYPVKAVEWLHENGRGRLLVDFNTGSFALWRLYPKLQVSLDGRYEELYSEETVRSVSEAVSGNLNELGKFNPDFILYLSAAAENKLFGMSYSKVYQDSQAAIFARSGVAVGDTSVSTVRPMWDVD